MEILLNPVKAISLLLVASGLAFGQGVAPGCATISPDAAKRQFDVASVKRGEAAAPLRPQTVQLDGRTWH